MVKAEQGLPASLPISDTRASLIRNSYRHLSIPCVWYALRECAHTSLPVQSMSEHRCDNGRCFYPTQQAMHVCFAVLSRLGYKMLNEQDIFSEFPLLHCRILQRPLRHAADASNACVVCDHFKSHLQACIIVTTNDVKLRSCSRLRD